jgi:hypothetical protein
MKMERETINLGLCGKNSVSKRDPRQHLGNRQAAPPFLAPRRFPIKSGLGLDLCMNFRHIGDDGR